jgi:hypothetical protein
MVNAVVIGGGSLRGRTVVFVNVIVAGLVLSSAGAARADERDQGNPVRPPASALGDGSFLPLTMPARVGGTQAFASAFVGYDSAHDEPLAEVAAEVRLWGPIALRGGAARGNGTQRMRPSIGARVQWLHQKAHGVDGSLGLFYKAEGFTEAEGEVEAVASVGRTAGNLALMANLAYGQDPEGRERDAELRAALLRRGGQLTLGIDARARSAIGHQARVTEPTFDAFGGPVAMIMLGTVAIFSEVGASALRMPGHGIRAGFGALGGIGSAF